MVGQDLQTCLLLCYLMVPAVGILVSQPRGHGEFFQEQTNHKLQDQHALKIELLRFVTPYGIGMDSLVDATPYSQLLESLLASSGKLSFYAEIDTWVSNDTTRNILYINNKTGRCTPLKVSSGNGWNLDVDLLIWPGSQTGTLPTRNTAKIRPKATVALAFDDYFHMFGIGGITVHEGFGDPSQRQVAFNEPTSLSEGDGPPAVYACPHGASGLKRDATLGIVASLAGKLKATDPMLDKKTKIDLTKQRDALEHEFTKFLLQNDMVHGEVTTFRDGSDGVELTVRLQGNASLRNGMPVFYASGSEVTDTKYSKTLWLNRSLPWAPFGFVRHILNKTAFVMNTTSSRCFVDLARGDTAKLPSIWVPKRLEALSAARTEVKAAIQHGLNMPEQQKAPALDGQSLAQKDGSNKNLAEDQLSMETLQLLHAETLTSGQLTQTLPLGYLAEAVGAPKSDHVRGSTQKVCVVQQRRHGQVLRRRFHTPHASGDRAVLQLTVTGHGWASTTEQCGEYCHAVYHLWVNGQSFANVTQWRDDCKANPLGPKQHGTWEESRNGWCPGSVQPGIFIDATKFLDPGSQYQSLELDISVWSNLTHRYTRYTDFSGFALGDQAKLAIAANILVYDKAAVAVALGLDRARTRAEAALRDGSSDPAALRPPAVVWPTEEALLQDGPQRAKAAGTATGAGAAAGAAATAGAAAAAQTRQRSATIEFERDAPWYVYNETVNGPLVGDSNHGVVVSVFRGRLIQINTRSIEITLPKTAVELPQIGLASSWNQVGLRIRLGRPGIDKLEIDHWDRFGSIGLLLPKAAAGVQFMHEEKVQAPRAASRTYRWKSESDLTE